MLLFAYLQTVFFPYFFGAPKPAPTKESLAPTPAAEESTNLSPQMLDSGSNGEVPSSPALTAPVATTPAITTTPGGAPQLSADKSSRYPSDSEIQRAGIVQVQTSSLFVGVSLLGGRITELFLNDFAATHDPGSPRLSLIEHGELSPFPLGVYSGGVDDAWVEYRLVTEPIGRFSGVFDLRQADQGQFVFEGTLSDGRAITKSLTFYRSGYIVDVQVQLGAAAANSSRLEIEWNKLLSPDSPSLIDPYKVSGYTWFDGEKAHREVFSDLKDVPGGVKKDLGEVVWAAESDKYFTATLISPEKPAPARMLKVKHFFSARILGDETAGNFKLYVGPKNYRLLQEAGYELRRTIDFGWAGFISAPLLFLLQFLYDIFKNFGVAVIALTILVRGALFPLNTTAFKQAKAMQELGPEMKRIRETITDKQQQQVELLALYKRRGVNPVGGCFPMLLQIPIFVGLYCGLLMAIELRHAPFAFWINDLSAPEFLRIPGLPFGIPVMVILWVISLLVQQWMTPVAGDPAQKKIMMGMSVVFGFMLAGSPAGVTLYLLTSNFISLAQQKTMQTKDVKTSAIATAGVSLALLLIAIVFAQVG